jgi:hypothetical protein
MFRFAQGFKGADSPKDELIKQFDEPKLSDEYDDLHTRRVCFGYGVSPQRLLRMQNRSTAQTNQEAAEEEGIAPFREWVEKVINFTLQRKMGFQKYEFKFDISQDPDPTKQSEIDATDLESGIATVNEKRIARGWDPRPEPEADKLGKWIATGWVPIDQLPIPANPGEGDKPGKSGAGQESEPGQNGSEDDDEPPPAGGKSKQKVAKAADGPPAILEPARDTIRSRAAKAALFAHVYRFFHAVKSTMVIVDPHTHDASHKMHKADEPDAATQEQIEQIVEAVMAAIPWKSLPDAIEPAISDAATEGVAVGLDQVERAMQTGPLTVSLSPTPVRIMTSSMISDVNQVAIDYAKKRSAELVGMKWVDGDLVTNPNAAMAITDSTRNMIRQAITDAFSREVPFNQLVQTIQNSGAFSEERAKLIADTEMKFAQSRGNLEAWKRSGVIKSIRWLVSGLHYDLDECDLNVEAGPIPIGEAFPTGDEAPPAHPRCGCVAALAELNLPQKKAA